MSTVVRDQLNRPLEDLRISVTDRCNFRCAYCMPEEEYDWLHRSQILTYEEIERVAGILAGFGVKKIRLTGGEPLLRKDLPDLAARLVALNGIDEVTLTTNGDRLPAMAADLFAAGVRRLNVSIDSLRAERFKEITRRGNLQSVLDGLQTAKQAGFAPIKLNAVIERGVNDDEVISLAEFAREQGFGIRYIEYMDVGNANHWQSDKLVPKREILATIAAKHPLREKGRLGGTAPAVDYVYEDGSGEVGFIASVTEPFCGSCTRARLTADGRLVTCLFSSTGHDIKQRLRSGATDEDLREYLETLWSNRDDRYSERRQAALDSPEGYDPAQTKKIEMITLGG